MPRGTTPFVRKTWDLLAANEWESAICWTHNGDTFAIIDAESFAADVLPQYFKHGNLCSFVRQLNTYGFKKVTSRDSQELEFKHKLFHRDHEELLPHITRRTASKEDVEQTSVRHEDLLYQLVDTNKRLVKKMNQLEEQRAMADRELSALRRELGETRSFAFQLDASLKQRTRTPPQCLPTRSPHHPSPAPMTRELYGPSSPTRVVPGPPTPLPHNGVWATLGMEQPPPPVSFQSSPELECPLFDTDTFPFNVEDFFQTI